MAAHVVGGGPLPPSLVSASHVNDPVDAHHASAIGTAGSNAWLDGTLNPASDVQTTLDKIIDDLVASSLSSGSHKIGSAVLVTPGGAGASDTPAGSIHYQLESLKDAATIGAGARPNWFNGTTNPVNDVATSISKIIGDLAALTGSDVIGSAALPAWFDATQIGSGSIFDQLVNFVTHLSSQTVSTSGGDKIGVAARGAWFGGFVTNPATTVYGALDKIITDLTDDTGASHIGIDARSDWHATSGVTNPGPVDVRTAIDKIITDLKSDVNPDGAGLIGAKDNGNNLADGTVRSQLDQLDTNKGGKFETNLWQGDNTWDTGYNYIFKSDINEQWSTSVTTRSMYRTLSVVGTAGPTDIWVDPSGSINNGQVVTALVTITSVRSPAISADQNGHFAHYLCLWSRDLSGTGMEFQLLKTDSIGTGSPNLEVLLTIGANSTTPKLMATGANASVNKVAHVIVRRTRHPSG